MSELEKTTGSSFDEEKAFTVMHDCVQKRVVEDRPKRMN
jgi:hypothetical protein